jgi:hypothetical protein
VALAMNISKRFTFICTEGRQTILRTAKESRSLFDHLDKAYKARILTRSTFDRGPTGPFLRERFVVIVDLIFVGLVVQAALSRSAFIRHASRDVITLGMLRKGDVDGAKLLILMLVL